MEIKTLKEREKEHLLQILKWTRWDVEKSALLLQISISQLEKKIQEHSLVTEKEQGSMDLLL